MNRALRMSVLAGAIFFVPSLYAQGDCPLSAKLSRLAFVSSFVAHIPAWLGAAMVFRQCERLNRLPYPVQFVGASALGFVIHGVANSLIYGQLLKRELAKLEARAADVERLSYDAREQLCVDARALGGALAARFSDKQYGRRVDAIMRRASGRREYFER